MESRILRWIDEEDDGGGGSFSFNVTVRWWREERSQNLMHLTYLNIWWVWWSNGADDEGL